MTDSFKLAGPAGILIACVLAFVPAAPASVDDAQSFALQAAEPYVKEGFQVREDYWGGDLAAGANANTHAIKMPTSPANLREAVIGRLRGFFSDRIAQPGRDLVDFLDGCRRNVRLAHIN